MTTKICKINTPIKDNKILIQTYHKMKRILISPSNNTKTTKIIF